MDFQKVVDSIAAMTCVVSVEKKEDGGHGEIRIVTGNRAYIDSIEKPMGGLEMLTSKFVPGSLYTDYMTRDLNFEEFCYRAAVEKKCLHSYAHPDRYDVWFNMTFMPLCPDEGDICYCTYTMEINFEPNSERMSNVSGDIAAAVLETAISIRGARNFKAAMSDAAEDIRDLCQAEYCGMLLVDDENQTCEPLGEAFEDDSLLRELGEGFLEKDFYPVARTWDDTISGSNCLIAKDSHDMEVVKERNPVWYKSLMDARVRTVALFPLRSRSERLGFIWTINFDSQTSTRVKEILELASFVLGSETGNDQLLRRLRVLSSRDMLTGVLNRNEMNNYVNQLCEKGNAQGEPVGVIFADLNGLKTINDSRGHGAGDNLLRNAASALREVFDDATIFRAGGDEFTVIITGVSEEETKRKAEALREVESHYPDVCFAIGFSHEADCRNVRYALAEADEKMYEDKRQFYASRGGEPSRHVRVIME